MTIPKFNKCLRCNGTGKVKGKTIIASVYGYPPEYNEVKCRACRGTGKLAK